MPVMKCNYLVMSICQRRSELSTGTNTADVVRSLPIFGTFAALATTHGFLQWLVRKSPGALRTVLRQLSLSLSLPSLSLPSLSLSLSLSPLSLSPLSLSPLSLTLCIFVSSFFWRPMLPSSHRPGKLPGTGPSFDASTRKKTHRSCRSASESFEPAQIRFG